MSHKNKLSLPKQVTDALSGKLRIGQSKFGAKKDGSYREGIYSYETYHAYTKHCLSFAKYCNVRFIAVNDDVDSEKDYITNFKTE